MIYDYYKNLLYRPDCGTENLCPLIYSCILFTGSKNILEIGMGSTSIFIIEALEKIRETNKDVVPCYYAIDNSIDTNLADSLKEISSFEFKIFTENFENLTFSEVFDLVLIDAGNHSTYKYFLENYWNNVKVGGLVFLHNPFYYNGITFEDSYLVKNLKKQKNLEIINLLEPNKIDQNGLCIIKKTSDTKIILED